MRPLVALVACTVLALPFSGACTTERVIVSQAPAPPGDTEEEPRAPTEKEQEEETPEEEEPKAPSNPLVVDLGEIAAGVDVPFEIPVGALGFNVTIEGKVSDFDPDRPYGIERITAPSGKIVHDDFTPAGGSHPTSFTMFDTIASVSVPQGEGVPEKLDGTWKLRVGRLGAASSTLKVKAKVRVQASGDGTFHGGKLDLHVHVPDGLRVDGTTIRGAEAETNAGLKQRIDTFFAVTSRLLGIERGDVVWHAESSRYAEVDTIEKLLEGFSISRGTKDGTQAFHVLLTNEISQDGEPFAAGISPGIPGAATIFGRAVSGIIVTTTRSAEEDVLTMLHEAGHFFGLNHTTELDGQAADPLSDTPRCTTIQTSLFSCPDRTNVMFAAGAIEGPVTLSPMQQRVFRGSPIYKAFVSGSRTMSLDLGEASSARLPVLRRRFRASNGALSPVERDLSLGYCGLTRIDAHALVQRHGRDAIRQLRAAAADPDLSPIIRGRARLALKQLGY